MTHACCRGLSQYTTGTRRAEGPADGGGHRRQFAAGAAVLGLPRMAALRVLLADGGTAASAAALGFDPFVVL